MLRLARKQPGNSQYSFIHGKIGIKDHVCAERFIEEAFEDMGPEKMLRYLHKIKKSSIIKRIGYMLEAHGYDAFPELNRYINDKYIPLDPITKHSGTKNRKWRLIT